MDTFQVDPGNRKQAQDFLALPFRLYRDNPCWVPPLAGEARLALDRKHFPFYRHSEAAFFLACRAGRTVGRIAVLDNSVFNEFNHLRTAFFNLFECEENPQAAAGLFNAAFEWARGRGLDRMIGPHGFGPLDGNGMLVQGFDRIQPFGMAYNPSYYVTLVEAQGFRPLRESASGYMNAATWSLPQRIHELSARLQERRGLHIKNFRSQRELRFILPYLKELYNGALGGTRDNFPLSDADMNSLARQLLWLTDPRLIKLVMKGEKPIGFLIAYPNVTRSLQKTGGRLFPFGWLTLLRALKTTDWVDLNGVGMLDEYRGIGGTAILFSEMEKSAVSTGQFQHAYVVQIGMENENMQRELSKLGINFCVMHRSYERDL